MCVRLCIHKCVLVYYKCAHLSHLSLPPVCFHTRLCLSPCVLSRYAKEGLSFSINSDDPGIMRSELVRDYQAAVEKFGVSRSLLPETVRSWGGHVCWQFCQFQSC